MTKITLYHTTEVPSIEQLVMMEKIFKITKVISLIDSVIEIVSKYHKLGDL